MNKGKNKGNTELILSTAILLFVCGGIGLGMYSYFSGDSYQLPHRLKKAEAAMEKQEYDKAFEWYEKALDLDNSMEEVYLQCAEILEKQGKQTEAVSMLQNGARALEKNPEQLVTIQERMKELYTEQLEQLVMENEYIDAKDMLAGARRDCGEQPEWKSFETDLLLGEADKIKDIKEKQNYLLAGYDKINDSRILAALDGVYLEIANGQIGSGMVDEAAKTLEEGFVLTKGEKLEARIKELNARVRRTSSRERNSAGLVTETSFSEDGKVLKKTEQDGRGNTKWVETYAYNEQGNLYQKQTLTYNEKNEVERFRMDLSMYNEFGKRIARYSYSDSDLQQLVEYHVYTYNEQKQPVEDIRYNGQGEAQERITYSYDENGRTLKKAREHFLKAQSEETLYVYDFSGNKIKEMYTYKDGGATRSGEITYTYNEQNQLEEKREGDITTYYEYNENKDILLETELDSQGKQLSETCYTYNAFKDLISKSHTGKDITETTFYEYHYQWTN